MGSLIRYFTWYLSDMSCRLSSRNYSTNSPTYTIGDSLCKFYLRFSFDDKVNQLSVLLCRCYDDSPTQVKARFSLRLTIADEDLHKSTNTFSFPKGGSKGFSISMTKEYLLARLENQCMEGTLTVNCETTVIEPSSTQSGGIRALSADLLKLRSDSHSANAYLNSEEERIPVHKEILSARSPIFKRMYGNNNCWLDTCFPTEVIKTMLDFLYSGDISKLDLDSHPPELLYACAEYYDIPDLKKLLTPRSTFINSFLNLKNEVHTVQFANFTKLCKASYPVEHHRIKMVFDEDIEMTVTMHFEYYLKYGKIILETSLCNLIGVKSLIVRLFILDNSNAMRNADEMPLEPDNEGRIKFYLEYESEKLFSGRNLILPRDILAFRYELKFWLHGEFHISDPEVLEEANSGSMSHEASTSLIKNMENLLKSKHFADAFLVLLSPWKPGVPKSSKVSVHKSILSARSPVFKDKFRADHRISVNLPVFVLNQFLCYVYTGVLPPLQPTELDLLHEAAETYNINTLKRTCEEIAATTTLNTRNIYPIYLIAVRGERCELQKSCKDFMTENKDIIYGSKKWEKLSRRYPKTCEEIKQYIRMKSRLSLKSIL